MKPRRNIYENVRIRLLIYREKLNISRPGAVTFFYEQTYKPVWSTEDCQARFNLHKNITIKYTSPRKLRVSECENFISHLTETTKETSSCKRTQMGEKSSKCAAFVRLRSFYRQHLL